MNIAHYFASAKRKYVVISSNHATFGDVIEINATCWNF